jgi:predicted GIY-YIG superfamily endonuclease
MKIRIYCIEDINGLKYVGSTKETLRKRHIRHKSKKRSTTDKCRTTSRYLDLDNSNISLLEECDENNRREREQFHILNTNCVNLVKSNRDFNKIVYLNWKNSFGNIQDNNLQTISPHVFL